MADISRAFYRNRNQELKFSVCIVASYRKFDTISTPESFKLKHVVCMSLRRIKVQPVGTERHQPKKVGVFYHKLVQSWQHSQIGHRSQYSIERLLAFQDYHERVSLPRAIAVCIATPIPAMLAALLVDCILLQPLSEGWKVNYALWIRLFLDAFAVAMGLTIQVKEVIVTDVISRTGAAVIALGTAMAYIPLAIVVAALWRFPIPLFRVLPVIPMVFFFCFLTTLVVGPSLLISSPVLRQQIKSQLVIVGTQGLVAIIFPVFSKIFQLQIIAKAAEGLHEYIGLIVAFSVDLFSDFYVAICMQTSKSAITTVLIIASASFHLVVSLRTIFQQVHGVKPIDESEGSSSSQSKVHLRDLPRMIRCVFGDTEVSSARSRQIRVFAPFPLPLSSESVAFLTEIARAKREHHVYSSSPIHLSGRMDSISRSRSSDRVHLKTGETTHHLARFVQVLDASKQNQIAPASLSTILDAFGPEVAPESQLDLQTDRVFSSKTLSAALVHKGNEAAVWDALQALFHSEYLLMAEYVECTLPLLYALYLSVLYNLPIAQYYPHTASMTQEKLVASVTNILLFGTVEFTTFVFLLLLLRKKFGVSPLYQLAFVLETQARTLQGHLFVWTIFILHLPLAHYGVNFNISLSQ